LGKRADLKSIEILDHMVVQNITTVNTQKFIEYVSLVYPLDCLNQICHQNLKGVSNWFLFHLGPTDFRLMSNTDGGWLITPGECLIQGFNF